MSTASNFSNFQLSGNENSRQNDEQSYQMQQYLQAGPTVTERIAQSSASTNGTKGRKKHGTEEPTRKLKKKLADLEHVIQGNGSSAA